MRRGLWFAAGAGAGVYTMSRVRRFTESLTADGVRDRMRGVAVGAKMFREEVRAGQHERETELRERFGLVPSGTPELAAAPAASTGPRPLASMIDETRDTH